MLNYWGTYFSKMSDQIQSMSIDEARQYIQGGFARLEIEKHFNPQSAIDYLAYTLHKAAAPKNSSVDSQLASNVDLLFSPKQQERPVALLRKYNSMLKILGSEHKVSILVKATYCNHAARYFEKSGAINYAIEAYKSSINCLEQDNELEQDQRIQMIGMANSRIDALESSLGHQTHIPLANRK